MCSVHVALDVQAAVVEASQELHVYRRFDENDDMVLEPLEVKRLLCAPLSASPLTLFCDIIQDTSCVGHIAH